MEQIYKYPRTRHVEGSRKQAGDEDLNSVKFGEIRGKYLVLEEKIDGANCGISFGEDGRLYLQSRGHFLNGGYGERQFDMLKVWAECFREKLWQVLGSRYVMYGEWMFAKHTVFYDELPHYFMEFDLFDKKEERFFSTAKRREILKGAPFVRSVPVLETGRYEKLSDITRLIGHSNLYPGTRQRRSGSSAKNMAWTKRERETRPILAGLWKESISRWRRGTIRWTG